MSTVTPLPVLLLLLGAAASVRACTQVITGGPGFAYPDQVMSARNMGFFMTEDLMVRT